MLSPRGQLRLERQRANGAELPYTECLRCDLLDAEWGCYRVPAELTAALRRIDRRFELIYDPITLDPGDRRPAFFLYSRTIDRNGSRDALKLELPLQWECDFIWPDGGPRAPGMWFIEQYLKRDNSREAGGLNYIDKLRMKQRYDRMSRAQRERDRPLIQFQEALDEELDPYLNKGRLSPALCQDGTQTPNRRKRKVYGLPTGKVGILRP